ncbi:hypothetical protein Q8791_27220 [Nocardiopsis sp. CT-R113]|uniref:Uncharacterized protein n=1 Tax=Nocardiopsis codii TaxID=3065942 RepID=A0ABU7KH32_9ACTN|nr:hypothetical protein [Nocardiopsis sp. CT-R113]MEE2040917.1 hypothetical protein [Nocardiopsis sp. CT-R113]
MPSTLSIADVMEAAGATRAAVVRVLTQGVTTETDWHIAHTIERLGGRRASELVLMADRDRMVAELWGDSGETAQTPAPTNPEAKYDSEVRVYPEATAPDAPATVAPHHPGDEPDETEQDPQSRREQEQVRVWAAVAGLIGAPRDQAKATADRVDSIVAKWTTPDDVREGLIGLLRKSVERGSERHRARAQQLITDYRIAA